MKTFLTRSNKDVTLVGCLLLFMIQSTIFCTKQNAVGRNKVIWQSSSKSGIEFLDDGSEYGRNAIVENHDYFLNWDSIVVSQITTWRVGSWEGNRPTLGATAYRIMPDGKQKELWSVKEEADEGRLEDGFYHTIWYGCCSAGPNHRLYNVETGDLIMEYCAELLRVHLGNPPEMTRYIGYKPAETVGTNLWEKHNKHIGTLTYSSPDGILHRIAFRGASGDYENYFGLGFADLSFEAGDKNQAVLGSSMRDLIKGPYLRLEGPRSSTDPKQFTDFRIRLQFPGVSIEIPIIEDDFLIDPSKFKDYEIIRVGLE